MRKLWSLLVSLLAVTVLLVGCGKEEPRTIQLLCDDTQARQTWQQLADSYFAQYGVQVEILCVEAGDYGATLEEAAKTGQLPEILCCAGFNLEGWEDSLISLTQTGLERLTDPQHSMKDSRGETIALGCAVEYTGLLVNKALLKASGHDVAQIRDLQTLKAVAEDISQRQAQLRFTAFAACAEETARQLLAGMGSENQEIPAALRDAVDMIRQYSTEEGTDLAFADREDALEAFANGEAAFCLGSSLDYGRLVAAGMQPEDLTAIPLYCGADGEKQQGLTVWTAGYWALCRQAQQTDAEDAVAFLTWVATSWETGDAENAVFQAALELEKTGRYIRMGQLPKKDRLEAGNFALRVYFSAPSEENWEDVLQAIQDS